MLSTMMHVMSGENPPGPPSFAVTVEQPADAGAMLVDFLRHRDCVCPRCEYNLRNAVSAACPECGEPLRLTVGLERPIMGALLTTVAPGLGCGVSSLIFGGLMFAHPGAPPQIVLATSLMFISGIVALAVLAMRRRFLRMPRERQSAFAAVAVIVNALLVIFFSLSFD